MTFERWMNTPAKPAVTSNEAGIRRNSSRFLALTASPSLRHLPQLQGSDQAHRIRLRAEVVVEEGPAAIRGDQRGGHAGYVERSVELDAQGQVVGKAPVDPDDPLRICPDEGQLPAGPITAAQHPP